ncbi:hypothetical protein RAA17_16660 [Komagataeibacter rhaeticus]|nr:hypothetical protein [Komagataeibacter rhaeticus]
MSQFSEFHEIEQVTDLEQVTDDSQPTEPVTVWYQFGKDGHGKHHGKREHIKPSYEISDNDRQKRARLFRNRAILAGLEDFANTNGYRATFLTITCDRDSVAQSKQCVSDLWNGLQKAMKSRGVVNFGMKSLEQQKAERGTSMRLFSHMNQSSKNGNRCVSKIRKSSA